MTDPAPEVVCDAGPLIHLDEVGCLELLLDFPAILVPEAVREEVELHRPEAIRQSRVPLHFQPGRDFPAAALTTLVQALALDEGEQAALALALGRRGSLLLTDDSAARLAARALGIRVHGTIGVLVRAIRRRQRSRSEILHLLRTLPEVSTLHIRRSLLDEVIRDVETASG